MSGARPSETAGAIAVLSSLGVASVWAEALDVAIPRAAVSVIRETRRQVFFGVFVLVIFIFLNIRLLASGDGIVTVEQDSGFSYDQLRG